MNKGLKKRAEMMFSPTIKAPIPPDGFGREIFNEMMGGLKSQAKDAAISEMQPMLDAAKAQIEAANSRIQAEIVSRETIEKSLKEAGELNTSLKQMISELEIQRNQERGVYNDQYKAFEGRESGKEARIAHLEKVIDGLQSQLSQARKVQTTQPAPTKVIQSAPISIPSFNVIPERDSLGNIINAKVVPIGGN